jgi:hypothetical protein
LPKKWDTDAVDFLRSSRMDLQFLDRTQSMSDGSSIVR